MGTNGILLPRKYLKFTLVTVTISKFAYKSLYVRFLGHV
eukprot:UN28328